MSLPASASQALTVTVRRGSTMTMRAAACVSSGSSACFLASDDAAQVRDPVVQEVVGLGLERVGADRHDRVGELRVLVAVVQLAHAHVARGVDLAVVGRAVVDADVLDLHGTEIELAGAPGVLVAAARTAMVEGGDEQAVLALLLDHPGGDLGHERERVVPGGRLHLAVAPDHGIGQPLQLGRGDLGVVELGHPRPADRAQARVHDAVLVRLDHQMHRPAVLADDVVHRRRVPGVGLARLLLAEVDAGPVVAGTAAALAADVPAVGLVAAADDAEVAGDVVDRGVLRDDRQPVDVALEGHGWCFLTGRSTGGRRSARPRPRRRCRPSRPR